MGGDIHIRAQTHTYAQSIGVDARARTFIIHDTHAMVLPHFQFTVISTLLLGLRGKCGTYKKMKTDAGKCRGKSRNRGKQTQKIQNDSEN